MQSRLKGRAWPQGRRAHSQHKMLGGEVAGAQYMRVPRAIVCVIIRDKSDINFKKSTSSTLIAFSYESL